MNAREVLEQALARLQPAEAWGQTAYARRGQCGTITDVHDTLATCWCLAGAVRSVTSDVSERQACFALLRAAIDSVMPGVSGNSSHEQVVLRWNDAPGRTHRDVRHVLRLALEAARRAEPLTAAEAAALWRRP